MNPKIHLGYELYRSLRRGFFKTLLVDYGQPKPIRLKGGVLLALALDLAKEIKKEIPGKRVGVVLPLELQVFCPTPPCCWLTNHP